MWAVANDRSPLYWCRRTPFRSPACPGRSPIQPQNHHAAMLRSMTRHIFLWAILIAAAACGGDDSLIGERVLNSPPSTEVTATPPVRSQAGFRVEFFWTGSDLDGEIAGFEWRISNNGPDNIIGPTDTLTANLPWNFTTATDSLFEVSADIDSFAVDVADSNQGAAQYRFWQTHTFFIRAVDDRGASDPTPAEVSFTATTLAPRVTIDLPSPTADISCTEGAKVLTFGWTSVDPDRFEGDGPAAVRYLLKPYETDNGRCLTQLQFENTSPITADDPLWSDWIPYDAPEDAGRRVTLPRQNAQERFLFAVQARDIAGAVTPTFKWNENVRHVQTSDGKYPVMSLCETFLGCDNYVGANGFERYKIVSGQPIEFDWQPTAAAYAGIIDACRYGWNVVDPDDPGDPGWAVPWGNGPAWREAPQRTFTQGSPNFVLQCRDNSGTVSRVIVQFQVIQKIPRALQRSMLFVDDWDNGDSDAGRALAGDWRRKWDSILEGVVEGFQPSDVLDVAANPARLSFELVNEYKSVVWFARPSDSSYFQVNLAPLSVDEPQFNWLEVYQARCGNLLYMGPGAMYNSVERNRLSPIGNRYPIIYDSRKDFGETERPDGTKFNTGITRWPYSAWCMEASSYVDPPTGQIFGEAPGQLVRNGICDGMIRAIAADEFMARYPDAAGNVRNLEPTAVRVAYGPDYDLPQEEFYNANVTPFSGTLNLRRCQVPMFRHRARRDEADSDGAPYIDDVLSCPRGELPRSALDGTVVALASSVYAEDKQLAGTEDFLWGFHPFAFEIDEVRDAIHWILESRWELSLRQ